MDDLKSVTTPSQTVLLPFRILPGRSGSIGHVLKTGTFALIFGAAAIYKSFIGHWLDGSFPGIIAAIFAAILARELIYLRRGSRHWLEVTAQGLTYTTPFSSKSARWSDVAGFTIRLAYSYSRLFRSRL